MTADQEKASALTRYTYNQKYRTGKHQGQQIARNGKTRQAVIIHAAHRIQHDDSERHRKKLFFKIIGSVAVKTNLPIICTRTVKNHQAKACQNKDHQEKDSVYPVGSLPQKQSLPLSF